MKDDSHAPSVSEAALAYALLGWPVFPAPPGAKRSYKNAKRSDGRKWGATTNPDEIAADWTRWPDANVGIVCGPKSGLLVIEADTISGHGVDGVGNLAELIKQNGPLPDTIEAESPSGSWHLYFRYPAGQKIVNSTSVVAPGIDVRGDGGMVVGVPSRKGDARYRWRNPPGLFELADCPEWLLPLCRKPEPRPKFKIETGPSDYCGDDERGIAEVEEALSYVDPDGLGYQGWVDILMALHAEFGAAGEAVAERWSARGAKFNPDDVSKRWGGFEAGGGIGIETVFARARENGCDLGALRRKHRRAGAHASSSGGAKSEAGSEASGSVPMSIALDDFVAFSPTHSYIYLPTRDRWVGASVDARVKPVAVPGRDKPVAAATWLNRNRPVEQLTWAPGEPMLIRNKLISEGGWIQHPGATVLNLYRPPMLVPAAGDASPWLDHLHRVFPEGADHTVRWLASRVQRPGVKINHGLVWIGDPGIGKDTIFEPVKRAVGPWNCSEVSPQQMMGRFNGFLKAVIIRVSEVRDLGDVDRYAFYEHTKTVLASPPEVHRVDEKNIPEYAVLNVCGVIFTSNDQYPLFLEPNDRRHYVARSELTAADFPEGYWRRLYAWFDAGGDAAVAAYLHNVDISTFDPKAPPLKTEAFWSIVHAGVPREQSEMADALDRLGNPSVVTMDMIKRGGVEQDFLEWLGDRKNAVKARRRLEACDYTAVHNPDRPKDGLWVVNRKRQVVYAHKKISLAERFKMASALAGMRT